LDVALAAAVGRPDGPDEEVAAYDAIVAACGDAADAGRRELVAESFLDKARALRGCDRLVDAIAACDEAVARFGDAIDPALRSPVASALIYKGYLLERLDRPTEAIDTYEQGIVHAGEVVGEWMREYVAWAIDAKACAQSDLGRLEDSIVSFDELVSRFGDAAEAPLRRHVAKALVSKGVALNRLDRPHEAITVYGEVVRRFGDEPTHDEMVATALFNKGVTLYETHRPLDAVAAYNDLLARFGDAAEEALGWYVTSARHNKGLAFGPVPEGGQGGRIGLASYVDAALEGAALVRRNRPTTPAHALALAQARWQEHSPFLFGELMMLEAHVRARKDEPAWEIVGAALVDVLLRVTEEDGGGETLLGMLAKDREQYSRAPELEIEVQEVVAQIVGVR
jgi:tetratricopeptide (TPR) repeat protein